MISQKLLDYQGIDRVFLKDMILNFTRFENIYFRVLKVKIQIITSCISVTARGGERCQENSFKHTEIFPAKYNQLKPVFSKIFSFKQKNLTTLFIEISYGWLKNRGGTRYI